MEVGDLGFLCDRKPCSKSTFKLFEQLFELFDADTYFLHIY